MGTTNKPDHLILNSPFDEPREYWEYVRETRAFRVAVKIVDDRGIESLRIINLQTETNQ